MTLGKESPPTSRPPRARRKEARPGEIIDAAIALFAEHGYGATRLEDVARRAGMAKGTLFVYFPTKQALFRAVAQSILTTNLDGIAHVAADPERPLSDLIPVLLAQVAANGEGRLAPIMRLLITEARSFPDLARVWHDEVVSKVLALVTAAIERAQARGEIRAGDPRLHAFSIIGPMLAATLYRQIFGQADPLPPNLRALASQHAATVIAGLRATSGDQDASRLRA